MTHHNDYIISGGTAGKSRLDVLSDVLRDHTKTVLEKNGVHTGSSFLDLGCGGGNVSIMVAGMVGDTGRVTAVDFDNEILSLARGDAERSGIKNISFLSEAVTELPFENEFDFVYARFLLSHVLHPAEIVAKMKQAARPGGKMIVEDVQFSGHFCYPACPAFDRYVEYYATAARQKGANPELGPSLPGLLREVALDNVQFEMIQPCFNKGKGKQMAYLTLDRISESLIGLGISTQDEITSMLKDLEAFTDDERTIMSLPRIFRAWGEKPLN